MDDSKEDLRCAALVKQIVTKAEGSWLGPQPSLTSSNLGRSVHRVRAIWSSTLVDIAKHVELAVDTATDDDPDHRDNDDDSTGSRSSSQWWYGPLNSCSSTTSLLGKYSQATATTYLSSGGMVGLTANHHHHGNTQQRPCVVASLGPGKCPLTGIQSFSDCFCTDHELSLDIAVCVESSCSMEDSIKASEVRQQLCAPYPRESRVLQVKIISSIAIALTFPIVIARLVARYSISGKLFGDDIVIVLASILAISADALILSTGFLGFGLHLWDVDPANAPALLQIVYAGQIVYSLVKTLAKVAILCLIRQVFSQVAWIQRVVKCGFVFYFCSGVSFTTVVVLQCLPIQANWIPSLRPQSKCLDIQAVSYVAGALTIAEDIFMIVLPLPHLLRMQMSSRKKLSVALLFGFAFVIVRLKYLVAYGTSVDLTWTNVEVGMWSMIEVHLNIICASLPALWRWFWNIVGAVWKMLIDRDGADAEEAAIINCPGNKLTKRVLQHHTSSWKDKRRFSAAYLQLQNPEENRMMHDMLFTPIPPLTHFKTPVRNSGGFDVDLTRIEQEGYYNAFVWKPPYRGAHRGW
ncbi:Satratoxin biosynthesis SC1 cluster protein 4 [Apiospora sp. TS-2023a]